MRNNRTARTSSDGHRGQKGRKALSAQHGAVLQEILYDNMKTVCDRLYLKSGTSSFLSRFLQINKEHTTATATMTKLI